MRSIKTRFDITCHASAAEILCNLVLIRWLIDNLVQIFCGFVLLKICLTIILELQTEMMPADSALDFDVHLQQSISTLQELSNAMSTDITILYTQRDMPNSDDDKVDPTKVRDDLMAAGYTW